MYTTSPKITGFHGTYPENVESILQNNFLESSNHNIWLGDGVYFFVKGIESLEPIEYAKQFAVDQCFNSAISTYSQNEVVVLQASIKINENKFLDLTQDNGNQLFNKFRDGVIAKITTSGKKPKGGYNDVDVFKIMREALGIEFVKANVYIKFAVQRERQISSKVPNVTILAVNNPSKNILRHSITEVYRGGIKI